jgi:hypothetical protein
MGQNRNIYRIFFEGVRGVDSEANRLLGKFRSVCWFNIKNGPRRNTLLSGVFH